MAQVFQFDHAQITNIERARLREVISEATDWLLTEFSLAPEQRSMLFEELQECAQILKTWQVSLPSFVRLHLYACMALGADYYSAAPHIAQVLSSDVSEEFREEWLRKLIITLQERDQAK
jgi:hypothetical protein